MLSSRTLKSINSTLAMLYMLFEMPGGPRAKGQGREVLGGEEASQGWGENKVAHLEGLLKGRCGQLGSHAADEEECLQAGRLVCTPKHPQQLLQELPLQLRKRCKQQY